jgi:hypothetical protein
VERKELFAGTDLRKLLQFFDLEKDAKCCISVAIQFLFVRLYFMHKYDYILPYMKVVMCGVLP